MTAFLSFFIDRARTVLTGLGFLLFAGVIAYVQIPKEAEPDLQLPIVQVFVALEGVSPQDSERLLVRPLEEQMRDLDGLRELRATATQGGAQVFAEFDIGTNIDIALQNVRTKVDQARPEMPGDIEEPQIAEIDLSWAPAVTVAIYGDVAERSLLHYARIYRDAVRAIPGVLGVDIIGDREDVVEIIIDPVKAQSYRLSTADMAQVFLNANRLVAAGNIDTGQGRFAVTVPGLFESADDILNLPVKTEGNAIVRVRDVAEIRRTLKEAESYARVNGQRAIVLEVNKRTGANLIETAAAARDILFELADGWPRNVDVAMIQDQSTDIAASLNSLQNSVLLAVFLVMTIVIAALGVRSGLLVGIAIPGAFLTGILTLYALGLTVNVTVMFGLIIAVGILVDGAIVVTEYANRKMAEGLDRRAAYLKAADRMAWPVIASTATTIAAFLPLLFWPDVVGQLMKFLPLTLIAVLMGSLAMALIFVPTVGALIGDPGEVDRRSLQALNTEDALDHNRLNSGTALYIRILKKALAYPGRVVGGMAASLVLAVVLYGFAGNGVAFFPAEEADSATILIHARGNLGVSEKDQLVAEVEQRILGIDGVDTVYSRTGTRQEGGASDVIGQITLDYDDWGTRRSSAEILADVKARTAGIAGIGVELQERHAAPTQGKDVQVALRGISLGSLYAAIDHVRRGMQEIGGFVDPIDDRPLPAIEWRLQVDRAQAARFGADIGSIGQQVRFVTNGLRLGGYRPDDAEEEVDILVRYPESARSVSELDELRVQTSRGLVPISNFVERVPVSQNSEIRRVDGRRIAKVEADVAGALPTEKVAELRAWLDANPLSPDVAFAFEGEQQDQERSGNFLIFAFAIAMFLMAAILLLQFNSFYSVFLILSSVILSTIGVLLGHLITGQPFSVMMSGIGVIALAGIVVNNNIVLIDTFDRLRKTAPSVLDAILQTGAQRLRPVLLTTGTTVLGLLPMAGSLSIDFFARSVSVGDPATLWWATLAMTIVSGLLFATILTLIFTPCALMLGERMFGHRSRDPEPVEAAPAPVAPASPVLVRQAAE